MSLDNLDIWLNVGRNGGNPVLDVTGGSFSEISVINLVAGDHLTLRVFLREISPTGELTPFVLADGQGLVFSGSNTAGTSLFLATDFIAEGEDDTLCYKSQLNLNTVELLDATDSLPYTDSLRVRCDLEMQTAANARRRTIQLDALIRKQVYEGGELPEPAVDPYPLPGDLLLAKMTGSVSVDAAAQFVEVDISDLGLIDAPARVLLTLRAPSAEAPLIFSQAVGAPTIGAFTVALSAPAPSTGYIIDYLLIQGSPT